MKDTLESLMKQVGCEAYPNRWLDLFEVAMTEYDTKGCPLLDPAYYDNLEDAYCCMGIFLDLYKQAALQTAREEPLARFLTLLCLALRHKEHRAADIAQLSLLTPPAGKDPLAYNMITGLALCSQLPEAIALLTSKRIPEPYLRACLKSAVHGGVNHYMRMHSGAPGFALLGWAQHYINGNMFIIERLEVEFNCTFKGKAIVYGNPKGEQVALAHDIRLHKDGFALGSHHYEDETGAWEAWVEETKDSWMGYPYLENGYVSTQRICLPKDQWKPVLSTGDPVIGLHIPNRASGPLTPEAVDRTLEAIKTFAEQTGYQYKAFTCHSWLMDPQLLDLVGADSNIGKFCSRFRKMTTKSAGNGVFGFIFNQPDMNFKLEELPENTRLEKALKEHYRNEKVIYEMFGYFPFAKNTL